MNPLDYLDQPVRDRVTFSDFAEKPFTAFLTQAVHLTDSFNSCIRHFQRKPKRRTEFTKDSVHSMHEIAPLILASLMSNLELFQRSLFARLIDLTQEIPDYSVSELEKKLRDNRLNFSIGSLLGYRGTAAAAGQIICSALSGWQNPRKVNEYSQMFFNIDKMYSEDICKKLCILWQLRHCIVHTGGTITTPDSQKLESLKLYGGRAAVFRHQFVRATVIDFHRILKEVRDDYCIRVRGRFGDAYRGDLKCRLDNLFSLDSPRKSWLK